MKRIIAFCLGAVLSSTPLLAVETHLSDLDLSGIKQAWGKPTANANVSGMALAIAGEVFERGIGSHADSSWKLDLDGKGEQFRAKVGVQDGNPGTVAFVVRGDGTELFNSGKMSAGDAAKEVRVALAGIKELELSIDGLGDIRSDHADWIDPILVHSGAPLPPVRADVVEPLLAGEPGEPANAAAKVEWDNKAGTLQLRYDGRLLFEGFVADKVKLTDTTTRLRQAVTQTLTLTGKNLRLEGVVFGGDEVLAAETRGPAQKTFPLVRTTNGGPSRNLRNNAVYDRGRDWMLAGPSAGTRLEPQSATQLKLICTGDRIELVFKPRYYQRHKNIFYFRPWTYQVRKDSISGWCSWWAFMKDFRQSDLEQLLAVWKEKRLAEYGYRFIQIDDCYQGGVDAERKTLAGMSGNPATWLDWQKGSFPSGMAGYVAAVKQAGFEPGVWLSSGYGDLETERQHPDWFVRDANGKLFAGPWIGHAIDASNPAALSKIVRPTYRGFKTAGFSYVKIDTLRHYLYDNLHHNLDYCRSHGVKPEHIFRCYLSAAREELGRDTFLLSCWGVLPEAVGLVDACRIGGDGYGPVTMQQYNSWNGIVWRNDPDHCDVLPNFKPAEEGNVAKTTEVTAAATETVIRPALASIAGCMLMLSDKPSVYRDEGNLEGLRRAAPVLFSTPGQLYDYDDSKSRNLVTLPRTAIMGGAQPSPIDGDQFGPVCPWWLNEFVRPFENWNVLNRLNWSDQPAGVTEVKFADLGLDAGKTYLVYEFWSHRFHGAFRDRVELPSMGPMGLASYAIREQVDHPQIVSTSRHLSQGGADLVDVQWKSDRLTGKSKVVAGDRYEIAIRVSGNYAFGSAEFLSQAKIEIEGELLRVAFSPKVSGEIPWTISFVRKK